VSIFLPSALPSGLQQTTAAEIKQETTFPEISIDLAVDSNGELSVGENGELLLTTSNASIGLKLLRRISTPVGGYSRHVRNDNGIELIDRGYENPLLNSVSAPLNEDFATNALNALISTASLDNRIKIVRAISLPERNPSKTHLAITYQIDAATTTTEINL
jgi:hypothetical protein